MVKYFETEFAHHIEIPPKDPSTAKHKPYLHDAGNTSAEIQRTTNNAPNLKDDGVMKNPSSKRSKTWNNLHFGNQGLSFEDDGNRITRCNIEVNNFSESKNDKPYNKQGGTGKGLHLLKDYETSIDSLSSKTDNTLQYGDLGYSNEVFEDMMWRHITGQPDGSDGEGNLCRSWVENEKGSLEIKEGTVWSMAQGKGQSFGHLCRDKGHKDPALSDTNSNANPRALDRKKRAMHARDREIVERLTRERFWKYHRNCCDENRPCPTAKKVIKILRNAPPAELDDAVSHTRPPCDSELLRNNDMLTVNLLVRLQERKERRRSRMSPWK